MCVSPLGSLSNVHTKHKIEFHLTTLHTYWSLNESLMKKLQFYINLFLNPRWHVCAQDCLCQDFTQTHTTLNKCPATTQAPLIKFKQATDIYLLSTLPSLPPRHWPHSSEQNRQKSLPLCRHSNQIHCSLETKTTLKGIWGTLHIDCVLQQNYLCCANSM